MKIELTEKFPDLMPGVLFIECAPLYAQLKLDTCRQNWISAHSHKSSVTVNKRSACLRCPVGRQLHGESQSSWSDVRGHQECMRCSRSWLRMVTTTGECVSCWNRRRETEIGRDRRGNKPKSPTNLTPYRLGVVIEDQPAYRQFKALHAGEALSRALRAMPGVKFHNQQPSQSVWNAKARRFEYRCSQHTGKSGALRERVSASGVIEYVCPKCNPKRAEGRPLASVVSATNILPKELVALSCNDSGAPETWISSSTVCDRCEHYPVQLRQRKGLPVEARCPLCDDN